MFSDGRDQAKASAPRLHAYKDEISRIVPEEPLRQSQKPLTAQEIAQHVMWLNVD